MSKLSIPEMIKENYAWWQDKRFNLHNLSPVEALGRMATLAVGEVGLFAQYSSLVMTSLTQQLSKKPTRPARTARNAYLD